MGEAARGGAGAELFRPRLLYHPEPDQARQPPSGIGSAGRGGHVRSGGKAYRLPICEREDGKGLAGRAVHPFP